MPDKFDLLILEIDRNDDVVIISETKIDSRISSGQFFLG